MRFHFFFCTVPILTISTPLIKRAGGPRIRPIPSNCTITYPLLHAGCNAVNANGYKPNPNFTSSHLIYGSYFEAFLNQTTQAQECLEQCYGFGNPGDCKAALLAYDVPTPTGFLGTAGGQSATACLLFDQTIDPAVFVPAPDGQYVNETAGNICCSC